MNSINTLIKYFLLFFSFIIVGFGQPLWTWWLGLVAAVGGFALFWRVLLNIPHPMTRFYTAMGWYAAIQIVQLSWLISHPYAYIYALLILCAAFIGAQWGLIALWITPANLRSIPTLCALAGTWTLLEWLRLFFLSGFPFNPAGLALSGAIFPLQLASLGGIYGLTFWMMLTNLFVLRFWMTPKSISSGILTCATILFPYLFGAGHFYYHKEALERQSDPLSVILIQSALPIEENIRFQSAEEARQFVLNEWRQILTTLKKHSGKPIDFIILPEYVVPYGTFHAVFPIEQVNALFLELFGSAVNDVFNTSSSSPYIKKIRTDQGDKSLASNAYFAQTTAALFNAHVVLGLEDSVYVDKLGTKAESYSAAFHFTPEHAIPRRYEKRVLVPMGEYIPFDWCKKLAAEYGITGSFTAGTGAKVFAGPVPFGVSICYEEIYGDLMRENRVQGAELLVNLTNDGWYPYSTLPKQHFDHARLRPVENGIPLVRACNTGVTGGYDSLGRIIGIMSEDHIGSQYQADSIHLEVPRYHYATLYSHYGDSIIVSLSCFCLLAGFCWRRKS